MGSWFIIRNKIRNQVLHILDTEVFIIEALDGAEGFEDVDKVLCCGGRQRGFLLANGLRFSRRG
ncbi:hypothetical protein DsansV1_C13g0125781 [Dioscorea sansibarensis]